MKDSAVHFPKTLTGEQFQDLLNEKKKERNVEFVKVDGKNAKGEQESPSPNFRSKKYVYKVPINIEAYQEKDYQK